MSKLTVGGTDWINNTITGIRFDFDSDATIVVDIDWIGVGGQGWGTQYFEDDVFFRNSNLTIQDTSTIASSAVFTKEYSFYDYLGKAATIRFEHNGYNADIPRKLAFNVNNIDVLALNYQGIATFSNIVNALGGNSTQWNTAYAHSQIVTGNPHNIDLADIGESYSSINYWTKSGNNLSYTSGQITAGGGNVNTSVDYTYNRILSTLTPTGDNGNLDFIGTHISGQCNNENYYINSAIGLRVSQNTTGFTTVEQYSLWVDQATGVTSGNYAARFNGNVVFDGFIKAGGYPLYFPGSAGSANYVLTTDGAGNLSWTPGATAPPGGGITTLNSQTQVTQSFANGSGISVTSSGGVHTITNTYNNYQYWSYQRNGATAVNVNSTNNINFKNGFATNVVGSTGEVQIDLLPSSINPNQIIFAFTAITINNGATHNWDISTYPNIRCTTIGSGNITINITAASDGMSGMFCFKTGSSGATLIESTSGISCTAYSDKGLSRILGSNTEYFLTAVRSGNKIKFNLAEYD